MIVIGDHVTVKIKGRVAKKVDGRIVIGKWIGFDVGDIGRVVNRRRVDDKWFFKVSLTDGFVEFSGNCLESLMDEEIKISRAALVNNDMRRMVSENDKDLTGNAEY